MQINSAKQRARVKALGEFGLGHSMWLESVPAPEFREDTAKEQPLSDQDQVDEIWDLALPQLNEAKNQEAGIRIYNRFTRGLENRGLVDTTPKRWQTFCTDKGWRTK
jgi:hypothetical protein